MSTNKILLAALAGGIAYFLLGWLVYGILLTSFTNSYPELTAETAAAIKREPMVMWAMFVSCLFYGLLFAVIFGRWAGIATFVTGAKAGAAISFIMALSIDLSLYSMYKLISLNGALIDPVIAAVLGGIVGGLVGWVLGYGKKAS